MKRQIITLVMAMMAVLTVSAQKKLVVVVDGVAQEPIDVWRVDEIRFIDGEIVKLNDKPDTLDFGLSVRWADRNMGAASPKDRGRLIGWGDTTLTNLSKKKQYFPIKDVTNESSISGSQYDVAKVKWGNKWHMPTDTEMQELIDACNWSWVEEDDSVGVIGKWKTDETKTIFFPVTGYREGEADPAEAAKGYYWTGSIVKNQTLYAKYLDFAKGSGSSATLTMTNLKRYMGLAIRPVTGPVKAPTKIESANVVSSSIKPDKASITVNMSGDMDDYEFIIVSYGTAESQLTYSNTTDAHHQKTTAKAKTITIDLSGLSQKTTYYVKVYVKTTDGRLESGVVSFTTAEATSFPAAEYVDLGLRSGVKWAKWNMGSKAALDVPKNDYARYFFGDPTGEVHSSGTPSFTLSTYATGHYDIGGTQYDIATVKWGSGWRTPSKEHFDELKSLTWKADTYTEDGYTYYAWKVTGKNGNYIYFPIIGCKYKNQITNDKETAWYWTSENLSRDVARYLIVTKAMTEMSGGSSDYQMPIRPIYVGDTGTTTPVDPIDNPDPNPNPNPNPDDNTPDGVEAIDLGLSVKWANKNVGAKYVSSAGNYYAWGDTLTRDVYNAASYIYKDNSSETGVNGMRYLGTSSNHNASYHIGGTEYDVAHRQWGGSWRMPTMMEFSELISLCTWTLKVYQDADGAYVEGYEITRSGYSGKLFLPRVGQMRKQRQMYNPEDAYYWTDEIYSSVPESFNTKVYTLHVEGDTNTPRSDDWESRYYGLPIRPVQPK